jgi:hypothetical protein
VVAVAVTVFGLWGKSFVFRISTSLEYINKTLTRLLGGKGFELKGNHYIMDVA